MGKTKTTTTVVVKPKGKRAAKRAVTQTVIKSGRMTKRRPKGSLGTIGNWLLPGIGGNVGNWLDGVLGGRSNGSRAANLAGAGRSSAANVNRAAVAGMEQIATIKVDPATPAGTILLRGLIAPPEIGIRCAQTAALWARSTVLQFGLVINASAPATVQGNYIAGIDPDPVTSYQSGAETPLRLMALANATSANAWADNMVTYNPTRTHLYNRINIGSATDAELRQYADGQYIIATTTEYPDEVNYVVNVAWHVVFDQPNTDELTTQVTQTYLLAAGGNPYTWEGTWAGDGPHPITVSTSSCWGNNTPPPDGPYDVAMSVTLPFNTGGATMSYACTSVEVSGDTTTLQLRGSTPPVKDSVIQTQRPTVFVVNPVVRGLTRVMAKVGSTVLSPAFLERDFDNCVEWSDKITAKRQERMRACIAERLLDRKLELEMERLSIEELQRCSAR